MAKLYRLSPKASLKYFYDNNSSVYAFEYDEAKYYYKKDLLGNVIEILDTSGNTVVKYVYDAWGNHKVLNPDGAENTSEDFIGNINPIRYRSYYYDTETKLYYLNSRYYDPEVCRFISPDDISYLDPETIGGTNLYAYCNNNPVMNIDPTGHFITALLIGMGISALFGGISSGISAYLSGERGWDLVADIIGGTIFGAAIGASIVLGGAAGLTSVGATVAGFGLSTSSALAVSVGATALGGAIKYSLDCVASPNRNWNIGGFVLSTVEGALQGLSNFGIAFLGGKSGLFNKLANFKTPDTFFIKHGGIDTLRSIVWGAKVAIGETFAKTIFVSGTSAILRFLIDMIIPN